MGQIFSLIGSLLGYASYWKLFGNYGWIILFATIILRVLMIPFFQEDDPVPEKSKGKK